MEMCTTCRAALAPGGSTCGVCGTPRPAAPPGTGVVAAPPAWPATPVPPAYGPPPGYGHPPAYGPPPAAWVPAVPVVAAVPQPVYVVPVAMGPPKSKAVAAVLCFFLGPLGIHRFYTGQTGVGLALLLTTLLVGPLTLGLFWIATVVWVLVDFVLILCGGVRDQYGREMVW